MKVGTLFGVGVGCGDPLSLTMKAVTVLQSVDCIFVASSSNNTYSIAHACIEPYLTKNSILYTLPFPMTNATLQMQEEAWDMHSNTIIQELYAGKNCAFATLGDPLIYSTFGYIMQNIQKKDASIPIEVIPGITSFQELAAKTKTILCNGAEELRIVPAIDMVLVEEVCKATEATVVLLRVAKKYSATFGVIQNTSRTGVQFGANLFRETEYITDILPCTTESIPYLSLIIMPALRG